MAAQVDSGQVLWGEIRMRVAEKSGPRPEGRPIGWILDWPLRDSL